MINAPTILHIEDSPDFAELVTMTLQHLNLQVTRFCNGADAWAYLADHKHPAAILLDLNMPIIDGWKFRQLQCAHPDLRNVPTIILSDESDLPAIAQSLNIDGFVRKRDLVQQLVPVLQNALRRGAVKDNETLTARRMQSRWRPRGVIRP